MLENNLIKEKHGGDQDMLEEVTILEEPNIADFQHLMELTIYTDKGFSKLARVIKHWEYKQDNAAWLLRELDNLNKQRQGVELRKFEMLEDDRFEEENYVVVQNKRIEIDASMTLLFTGNSGRYSQKDSWSQVSKEEQKLEEKLQEIMKTIETQSSPVEELSQILKREENFLHFILQNAPVEISYRRILA